MVAWSILFPGLLWAAAGAAAPVVIHLLMRPRPRKFVLPTMRFVRKTHRAQRSRHRLKHLLLLLMRMALMALLALLLAGLVQQRPAEGGVATAGPRAVAVVIDTSASMGYQLGGESILAPLARQAAEYVESLPPTSRVVVLDSSEPDRQPEFLLDRSLAAEAVLQARPGPGSGSVAAGISRAMGLLAQTDLPARELLILSDLTARGWQGASPIPDSVRCVVYDGGVQNDANRTLGWVRPPEWTVPLGQDVSLSSLLTSRHAGGAEIVTFELLGEALATAKSELEPGSAVRVEAEVRPPLEGVLHGRAVLEGDDPLAMDNVRYYTISVGPPPTMFLVTSPTGGDPNAMVSLSSAVAPPLMGGRRLDLQRLRPDELAAQDLSHGTVVILFNVAGLSATQWEPLEAFVRDGGGLWVLPGPASNPADYNSQPAQRLLPVRMAGSELLDQPSACRPGDRDDLTAPFRDRDNPPLSDVRVTRRFRLEAPAADAIVPVRFADGTPAILRRTVGEGTVLFWNLWPGREWSNLARKAGQMVILSATSRDLLLRGGRTLPQLPWGREMRVEFPAGFRMPEVTLQGPGRRSEQVLEADIRRRQVVFRPERLGGYTLRFTEGDRQEQRGFSVNISESESDLSRLSQQEQARLLPGGHCRIVRDGEFRMPEGTPAGRRDVSLLPVVLVAMLGLLTAESYFANRFYRVPEEGQGAKQATAAGEIKSG